MHTNMIDFKALMAGSKPIPVKPDVKPEPISTVIKKEQEQKLDHSIDDIQRMLIDKTIPLNERLRLRATLKERLAKTVTDEHVKINNFEINPTPLTKSNEQFALSIQLNKEQQLAADYAAAGKSFVLTGKAGTGKTTAAREIARALLDKGILGQHSFGHYKPAILAPSIAFTAFTNRATDNLRRSLHKDPILEERLKHNVLTIHKLLEYTMEFVTNEEGKTVPRFYPKRDSNNPLDITHLVVEESSMVDIPLWRDQLFAALKPGTVVIFIGDINQLPPVFGPAVLNYALTKLPVVELKQVYRQALDSPILSNALKVLEGIHPTGDGKALKIFQTKPGGKSPSEAAMGLAVVNSVKQWFTKGEYNPITDIMLSPYNKDRFPCGTKVLNYHIAQFLGDRREAKVHHIQAGRNEWFLAEGDRVMIEKQDGVIEKINLNANYMGKASISTVCDINRFGKPLTGDAGHIDSADFELEGYEELNVENISDEEKKLASSHIVHVKMDDGAIKTLDTAGEFADTKFSLGYCLSVHKAQGSEWRKVVLVIHKNFKTLLFRELIYTAMTRAKEELVIVDMSNALPDAIKSQRIKGNTVKEKIEWFNSRLSLTEDVPVIP